MVSISFVLCIAVPCTASLGMENRLIKDAQITASSERDSNHAAIQARLNFKAGGGKQGAWSAGSNDANQWIQVALGSYSKLTVIATQGRNGHSQWVTKYQLQYSNDGANFDYYKAPGQSLTKVFNGNKDADSIVYHKFNPPIQAGYIRLRPTAWSSHISLRMELYGCPVPCTESLGMENRLIKDAQITASSEQDSNHAAIQARLNFKAGGGKQGGWSAGSNDANQWIQVALDSDTKLTGIATQGRNGSYDWVTKYQLQFSDDGVNFDYYKAPGQSLPKVFDGNKDTDSIVYHKLNPPIQAGYIRLRPTEWLYIISLRMELYGCLGMIAI
ncbi:EGF-like repeat and discoidin I-like domain-containing protein 3 [Orbicella faveolata]|uniref:EGF-like repeat and discoidin I-like domain-containing protein 3 n=1 Tax=Orbicella faveolata TaxID=48498 RepID=UPI0009E49A69|nr:EGF-like repeat and discoidin I-like domain-containing protein 3 [Orbicella faveolata]